MESRILLVAFSEFVDPHPAEGNQFGANVVALSTGNVVITSPYDDAGGTDAGAVYLFNGSTGALISTLTGSQANDQVGSNGVTALSNGNYVVRSDVWDNGGVVDVGAVTWGSGTTGISGVVSAANSLIGGSASDNVGYGGVTALSNGNYVVSTPYWSNGGVVNAGAVTWGNGTTGISGSVSAANSLVGSTAGDGVGYGGVTALSNGNYVVNSYSWDNGGIADAGAVTWGSGTTGISGAVSAANSLVGSTAGDNVGYGGVTALSNGNYVVSSPLWDNGGIINAGAVTWGSGTTGISGAVSAANSLVGSTAFDQVGGSGVTALSNGNYFVGSYLWNNGGVADAGAVTWGSGTAGVKGVVSAANSLVGSTASDYVGNGGVTELSNGNYVVSSYYWSNGGVDNAGAVTWWSGTTGISGEVSAANSLVGTTYDSFVGIGGVTALSNGNYVVVSPSWDNGGVANAGAVTWGSGTTGNSGVVSAANSLVGSTASDQVGIYGVTPLSNGNYVVSSYNWDNGGFVDAGAVTWRSGTTGVSGAVSAGNSLVGLTSDANLQPVVVDPVNGTYFGRFLDEDGGRVRVGVDVTITFVAGVLTVTGSGLDDAITVRNSSGTILIDLNGSPINTGVATANVTSIEVFGLKGDDTLTLDSSLGSVISSKLLGGDDNDILVGGLGNDTLDGGTGNDTLTGNAGNDKLIGRGGADSLNGRADNDTLYFDNFDTSVIGGTGTDTAVVYIATSAVNLNLAARLIETVSATTSTFNNTLRATGATWAVSITGGSGNDTITGGTLNDKLVGGEGNDTLDGGAGDDNLIGGAGNDKLIGRGGADSLNGGSEDDTLYFDELDTNVQGRIGTDTAIVYLSGAGVSLNLTTNQIEVVLATTSTFNNTFSAANATWPVTITGGSGNDTIIGGNLNDTLDGREGNDTLIGNAGDDTLTGGLGIDTVSYATLTAGGVGVNVNLAHKQATGAAGTDTLIGFENVIGSSFNDTILGNSLANILNGGPGTDTIIGGVGDTILNA